MSLHSAVRMLSGRGPRRWFTGLMRDRASIFMLHRLRNPAIGVDGHTVQFVREALAALAASGAKFVSLRALVANWRAGIRNDPNAVAFTIDDGFADQAVLVREAFVPAGCPVTVFLVSDFLDGRLWPWDDQLAWAVGASPLARAEISVDGLRLSLDLSDATARSAARSRLQDQCKLLPHQHLYETVAEIGHQLQVLIPRTPPANFSPLSWDTVRELETLGAEFGPHSVSHRIFSRLSDEEAAHEIHESWRRLRQELRNPVPIFAWPTGRRQDFSRRDETLARSAGLDGCVATDADYAHVVHGAGTAQLYGLRRFGMPRDVATVLRYGSWIERARQLIPV